VALAARLVLEPEVLLLDEPTASVDADSALRIREAALRARSERGTTLLVASHDRPWLYEVCDEVVPMFRGRILAPGAENVLLGPWLEGEDGLWTFEGGQEPSFRLPAPPSPQSAAVFGGGAMRVLDDRPERGPSVEAVVSHLIWERSTNRTVVTFTVSGTPVTLKLEAGEVKERGLFPGRRVWIAYDREAFQWIP
jgi:tungstate transport system ATP-binding protein